MTAEVCGVSAAGLIVWAALLLGNHDSRIVALGAERKARRRFDVFGFAGRSLLSVARHRIGVTMSTSETRAVGIAGLVALCTSFVFPPAALAAPIVSVATILVKRRSRVAARRRAIVRELPMTVDLLRLGVRSGLNITAAVTEVANYTTGPLAVELSLAVGDAARGMRLADALDGVVQRAGDDVGPLIWSLASSERYGAPLSDVLERLAQETRVDQERRAEQAARRLSVQLLFPLAGCILPAFALLTVVPMLAGSLTTLASNFH